MFAGTLAVCLGLVGLVGSVLAIRADNRRREALIARIKARPVVSRRIVNGVEVVIHGLEEE